MANIKIDKDKCIGCGTCVSIAPDTFELSNDGKSKVIKPNAEGKEIEEAIESCPNRAISK